MLYLDIETIPTDKAMSVPYPSPSRRPPASLVRAVAAEEGQGATIAPAVATTAAPDDATRLPEALRVVGDAFLDAADRLAAGETAPLRSLVHAALPAVVPAVQTMLSPALMAVRRAPESMTHADTLIQWRLDDEREWEEARRKEASLSPRLGRVLCLGFAHDDGDVVVPYAYTEAQERDVLRAFWAAVREADGQICGFNSRPFDVPFLLVRSAINDVVPSVPPAIVQDWLKKYQRSSYHLDLREALTGGEQFAKGKLDQWSKFFGGQGKLEGFSGKDVYPAFLRGEHERIIAYQIPDVTETRFVARKLERFFSLPTPDLMPDLTPSRVGPAEVMEAPSPFTELHALLAAD